MEFIPSSPGALRRRLLRVGPYEKDPMLAEAVHRRLASGRYAAVQAEKPAMLPYVPKDLRIPLILDTFAYGLTGGVRALRNEPGLVVRARNLLRLIRSAAFDAFCWPATHCILVVSEVDRQRCLRERPRQRVLVVPNGVDCEAIRPGPFSDAGPPILVFTGDMSFDPNVHAAQVLASRVFPQVHKVHPDAKLHLVGRNPDPRVLALRGPGVVVTGEVPDMVPHLHAASVYVAPLATGAGTRTKLLEALGYRVLAASSGEEALRLFERQQAEIDLLITDVVMPGMGGKQCLEALLSIDPAVKVIIASGYSASATTTEALSAGARGFANKPYDIPQVLEVVRSVLDERSEPEEGLD